MLILISLITSSNFIEKISVIFFIMWTIYASLKFNIFKRSIFYTVTSFGFKSLDIQFFQLAMIMQRTFMASFKVIFNLCHINICWFFIYFMCFLRMLIMLQDITYTYLNILREFCRINYLLWITISNLKDRDGHEGLVHWLGAKLINI